MNYFDCKSCEHNHPILNPSSSSHAYSVYVVIHLFRANNFFVSFQSTHLQLDGLKSYYCSVLRAGPNRWLSGNDSGLRQLFTSGGDKTMPV